MGKLQTKAINRFDGGMTNDRRDKNDNRFAFAKHFDFLTYPHKLVPNAGLEDYHFVTVGDGGVAKSYDIVEFQYGKGTAGAYKLFGRGISVGGTAGLARIFETTIDGTVWDDTSTNWISTLNPFPGSFLYYKNFLYLWGGTTKLIKADADHGDAIDDAYQTVATITSVAQALVHPSDDVAYFFTNNLVHSLNDTTWAGSVLTLPSNLKITCACPFGDYLAIGCVTTDLRFSRVYLWDRDASVTTLSTVYDMGEGEIFALANLDNKLVALINYFLDDSTLYRDKKILIKQANGTSNIVLNEIVGDYIGYLARISFTADQKLYFPASIPMKDDTRFGVWAVDSYGRYALETSVDDVIYYDGLFKAGGVWFIAHSADGSIKRTDLPGIPGASLDAVYETNFLGETHQNKQLMSVGVMTEPLIGTITLKYRLTEGTYSSGTAWTTIFTLSTAGETYHEAVNIESSGAVLPEFREIQFRVESTSGATITGIKYTYEEKDSNPN